MKEKLQLLLLLFLVASACDNTLIEAKLEFFVAVAKLLQEFLLKFQTEVPVTPFLTLSLKDLLLAIMDRFLKKVLEKTDMFKKLSTIDPADKKNQKTQTMLTLALLLEVLEKN